MQAAIPNFKPLVTKLEAKILARLEPIVNLPRALHMHSYMSTNEAMGFAMNLQA